MPTKPSKGDHGTADQGSKGRGAQKATTGSAVSAEVADQQRAAVDEAAGPGEPGPTA